MKRVRIQLTGEVKGYIDLKDEAAAPLIISGSDVRDITEKSGNKTRTLIGADTPNNHKLFEFIFNVNVKTQKFNKNKKTECILLEGDEPIMDNAVLQLTGIRELAEDNNHIQKIEYNLLIKDQTSNFFLTLGASELTDLKLTDLSHNYTATNVIDSFSNTIAQGYKYLMPFNNTASYNLSEFKPAIYAKIYWDRIFESNGFSYDWEGIDDSETMFSKWIIPYNGDAPKLRAEDAERLKVKATLSTEQELNVTGTGALAGIATQVLEIDTEVLDESGSYNPSLYQYTSPVATLGDGSLLFNASIEWEVFIENLEAGTIYLKDINSNPVQGRVKYKPIIRIGKNGAGYGALSNLFTGSIIGEFEQLEDATLATGETILQTGTTTVNLGDALAAIGAVYDLRAGMSITEFGAVRWKTTNSTTGVDADIKAGIRIKSLSLEITPSVTGIGYGQKIYINDYIPKGVKQSEFIKSILTINNLYVDIDQFNANKLILKKRDRFFDSGKVKDWTKKIDKKKERNLQFLSSMQVNKTVLTYKQDTDAINKGYEDATGEIYGQIEFRFENDFSKEKEKKELIFSPSPVGLTSFGAVAPYINGAAPKTGIRLLFDGGALSCQPYEIIEFYDSAGVASSYSVSSYPHLSHFDKPVNPTFDLNFGVCDFYFYNSFGARTNNNAYNLNWRRTFNQLDNGEMLTAYFNLTRADISQLRKSDKIQYYNQYYNINKIEYNANSDASSRCELITVDEEQKLKPFKTKLPFRPFKGDQLFSGISNLISKIYKSNNLVLTASPVDVQGKSNTVGENVKSAIVYGNGNNVSSENAVIIGNGFTAEESGLYTEKIFFPDGTEINQDNAGNFAIKDLVFTGNREHDLAGFYLWLKNGLGLAVDGSIGATGAIIGESIAATATTGIGLNISTGIQLAQRIATADTVLTEADYILICKTGVSTVTLPPMAAATRTIYKIKNSYTGGNITLAADGSEDIDGSATYIILNGESVEVTSDGTEWKVIGKG